MRSITIGTAILAAVLCIPGAYGDPAPPADAGRAAMQAAAEALGGLERIRSVKTLTLYGYGDYAYQFGGGNVTASLHAAQRFQAAHDLRRVFDFDNDRFQQKERRNMSFTFALAALTSWAPYNQILDGDLAFDIGPDGKAGRIPRFTQTAWQVDGVHMRRMWKLNNPVALVRAALDPAAALTNLHTDKDSRRAPGRGPQDQGGRHAEGGAVRRNHLPAWVRWSIRKQFRPAHLHHLSQRLGPVDGPAPAVELQTRIDWRNIDYLKMHVDGYVIDGKIADLAAPAAVRAAPEPAAALKARDGGGHRQGDLAVVEPARRAPPCSNSPITGAVRSRSRQDYARPSSSMPRPWCRVRPATQLITSHAAPDHLDGIRVAVAQGLTVISRRDNEDISAKWSRIPRRIIPDALSPHPGPSSSCRSTSICASRTRA